MKTFRYARIFVDIEETEEHKNTVSLQLNELGLQGYELVFVVQKKEGIMYVLKKESETTDN